MKKLLLILALISCFDAFSQDLPDDNLILKTVFGKTDKNADTYSRKLTEEEAEFSYEDKITYQIVFKEKLNLDNRNLIMCIIEAPNSTHQDHQFGYRDIYFFEQKENTIEIKASIKSDGEIPIGDESAFQIIDIGENKKALITSFISTGNQHYENTKDFQFIELKGLTYLFSICSEYDNSMWNLPESENDDCPAERYEESYKIIKSDKEWYDIKVHRTDYKFTKGCEDSYIRSETDKIYTYTKGKYTEN